MSVRERVGSPARAATVDRWPAQRGPFPAGLGSSNYRYAPATSVP
ncbi:hypothetical protein ACSNN7_11135 [Micromonospora sp. URMC 105]